MMLRNPRGPLALYVCSKSRAAVMERYELGFGMKLEEDDAGAVGNKYEGKRKFWVDWKRDVIVLDFMGTN
jgi:hypothetical protein